MDVFKCIVSLRHGGTINSRRAANPLVWLVEGVERWEAPDQPQVSSLKIGVETCQIVLSPVIEIWSISVVSDRNDLEGQFFVQTGGMPNSPSQVIRDMPDWRQIWGSGRPRKGCDSYEIVF
ncbi:hypothetical protein TNCV_829621 [Trichonephila clavipes]|nr:hypothetical protein TNCV_829621 [Trichonephila clavipes]